ncbi:hypothetical protein BJX96DRAFT_170396 [Aspergillus floccosus]
MYRLFQKKYTTPATPGSTTKLTAAGFGPVLGDSVGVTDLIAAEFAPELTGRQGDTQRLPRSRRVVPQHAADDGLLRRRSGGLGLVQELVLRGAVLDPADDVSHDGTAVLSGKFCHEWQVGV